MLGAMLLGVPLAALTARYVIVGRDFLAEGMPRESEVFAIHG